MSDPITIKIEKPEAAPSGEPVGEQIEAAIEQVKDELNIAARLDDMSKDFENKWITVSEALARLSTRLDFLDLQQAVTQAEAEAATQSEAEAETSEKPSEEEVAPKEVAIDPSLEAPAPPEPSPEPTPEPSPEPNPEPAPKKRRKVFV